MTQKEETIVKLQNLLQAARDEMADLCNKHETDMKLMVDRLHIKSDDAFTKFKATAISNVNQRPSVTPTSKQVRRQLLIYILYIHTFFDSESRQKLKTVCEVL